MTNDSRVVKGNSSQTKGLRQGGNDLLWVIQGCQFDDLYPIWERGWFVQANFDRKACFARAAGSCQRDKAC